MQDAKTFARWHLQKRLRDVARLQPRALNAKGIVSQAINPKIIALTKHRAGVHNIVGIKCRLYRLKRAPLYRTNISFKVLRF